MVTDLNSTGVPYADALRRLWSGNKSTIDMMCCRCGSQMYDGDSEPKPFTPLVPACTTESSVPSCMATDLTGCGDVGDFCI